MDCCFFCVACITDSDTLRNGLHGGDFHTGSSIIFLKLLPEACDLASKMGIKFCIKVKKLSRN